MTVYTRWNRFRLRSLWRYSQYQVFYCIVFEYKAGNTENEWGFNVE